MRVVGQLSTLVTCIFAIAALRTQVDKVWWETHSPARLFTSEALRLEGMERFISPNNFPSFFKWYLLQLLTSPSASENGMSQETPRAKGKGKGSIGKLIQDLQLTPRLVVHSAMGHGSTGSKYSGRWYGSPRYAPMGSELGASRWQTAAYIQAVHPGGSYPQRRPEAGTSVTQPQGGQHRASKVCRCMQGLQSLQCTIASNLNKITRTIHINCYIVLWTDKTSSCACSDSSHPLPLHWWDALEHISLFSCSALASS